MLAKRSRESEEVKMPFGLRARKSGQRNRPFAGPGDVTYPPLNLRPGTL